jgi:Ca-activated chloride channel family protein
MTSADIWAPLAPALADVGIEAFERPGWLLLAIPLAAAVLVMGARARPLAIPWPGMGEVRRAGARTLEPSRAVALGLRALAAVALIGVLAGPVGVHRAPPEPGFGLDLVLAVDASGSMRALDARADGEWRTRLDLARQVVARFAEQRAAEGDRVALVVFGETAFTQCPLTSDGALLANALERVETGVAGEATALGDALTLAVRRALAGASSAAPAGAGRVVVLLTDGRNNAGSVSVEAASAVAAAEGIRVHTVGIGTAGEEVAMATRGGAGGRRVQFERHDVDRETLERIAAATGGRFFPARRSSDLRIVYDEIDALERVATRKPPRIRHSDRPEPLLALAGGFLLAEIGLARVVRRRLP